MRRGIDRSSIGGEWITTDPQFRRSAKPLNIPNLGFDGEFGRQKSPATPDRNTPIRDARKHCDRASAQ